MFADFSYCNFPVVYVTLGKTIMSTDDFTDFTNKWLELYNNKTNFEFVFDTSKVGFIHPKYCIYMAFFIKLLKKRKVQYLTSSTIYIYNKHIYNLLKIIFSIERPVAPVHLHYYKNGVLDKSTITPN